MNSRFSQVTLLDEAPAAFPKRMRDILCATHPEVSYAMPYLPGGMAGLAALAFVKQYIHRIKPYSLLVGHGNGGLVACALQEAFPVLYLSAFAVNAPTEQGRLWLHGELQNYNRVSLYSSAYPAIKHACNWASCTPLAFDVPWLSNGVREYYAVGYLVSSFMRGLDMEAEVAKMFPSI
jgi:hypothetical protein